MYFTFFRAVPFPMPSMREVVSQPDIAWIIGRILQSDGLSTFWTSVIFHTLGGVLAFAFGVDVMKRPTQSEE